jgi:hypothetical protein
VAHPSSAGTRPPLGFGGCRIPLRSWQGVRGNASSLAAPAPDSLYSHSARDANLCRSWLQPRHRKNSARRLTFCGAIPAKFSSFRAIPRRDPRARVRTPNPAHLPPRKTKARTVLARAILNSRTSSTHYRQRSTRRNRSMLPAPPLLFPQNRVRSLPSTQLLSSSSWIFSFENRNGFLSADGDAVGGKTTAQFVEMISRCAEGVFRGVCLCHCATRTEHFLPRDKPSSSSIRRWYAKRNRAGEQFPAWRCPASRQP